MDSVLLRELLGEEAVTTYNHAYRLLSFSLALPIYFRSALFPLLSRLAEPTHARPVPGLDQLVRKATFALACVALPVVAIAVTAGSDVLELLWDEPGDEASKILLILSCAGLCLYFTYPKIFTLIACGWQTDWTAIAILAGVFKLTVGLALIREWGTFGAAFPTLWTELAVYLLVTVAW
jgi:O-antigen/teichoic acid export membrane protein